MTHNTPASPTVPLPTTQVHLGDTTVTAEIADTPQTRTQGLSGRASLSQGSGMLFVFQQSAADGFWMKDMNFPLDIMWADSQGVIITIDQNLSPQTYHTNPPEVFYPDAPALYVLEVPAGFAAAHGIVVGSKITFSL